MKGFRVEGQQLGAPQTETIAHPGDCRHFGHATKLHCFKSHNTREDLRFGGPDDPRENFGCIPLGGPMKKGAGIPWGGYHGGVYRHATMRNHVQYVYIYIYIYMYVSYIHL